MRTRLFSDADNTLWDTDAVYASAQLGLARDIAAALPSSGHVNLGDDEVALAFVRAHDQRIAADHPDGLRYPVAELAQALRIALGGFGEPSGADNAVNAYEVALKTVPQLRAGVREAVPAVAAEFGGLTIVTETSETRCAALLAHHGLDTHVNRIICCRKDAGIYRTLRRTVHRDVMVGDQLDRDIAHAQAAGFEGVLFPGRFVPFWLSSLSVRPDHVIGDFRELLTLF